MADAQLTADQYAATRDCDPSVVETASRVPGYCALTLTTEGPFIDTGWWVPGLGTFYISLSALRDLYSNAGWTSREKTATMRERMKKLEAENAEIHEELERLRSAVAGFIEATS